jgi:glycerol uptake facilitator-like aquaporin
MPGHQGRIHHLRPGFGRHSRMNPSVAVGVFQVAWRHVLAMVTTPAMNPVLQHGQVLLKRFSGGLRRNAADRRCEREPAVYWSSAC